MTKDSGHGTGHVDRHRSRRQLVAGAAGALGALTAGSLLEAPPAQAVQGSPVIEGQDNTGATARTGVFTPGNNEFGILADPDTSGHGSLGVFGFGATAGVLGQSGLEGVRGEGGTGVAGTGAFGVTGNGTQVGVFGFTATGTGVGVMAETEGGGTSAAFQCRGPAVFDRSGVASVTFPRTFVSVRVHNGLSASAIVLALMQNAIAGVYVTSAVPDRAASTITIHLNKAPGSASRRGTAHIAWFVVN